MRASRISIRELKKGDGMDELEKLKQLGAPHLTAAKEEQNDKIETCIILLDRLCTLKEEQQAGDIKFRNKWARAKLNDTRISLVLLVLANIAIYLDVVEVNGNSALINGVVNLTNVFVGVF